MYLFKQIGEWNPQILREFKGRLKTRNIVLGIFTSLGIQLLLLLYFAAELPVPHSKLWQILPSKMRRGFVLG